MHQHITRVTSTCFLHLRWRRKLNCIPDIDVRKRLVCAVILTRVDYWNSALAGLFVLDLRPRDHITVALQTLHWLPERQRITYKLCTLMYGVAFGYAPLTVETL